MSRTDRTRPSAVRMMEDLSFLEAWHSCAEHGQHNTATGECDLPERPTGRAWAPGARYDETRCSWSPSHTFWRSADGGACRCKHCMGESYATPQRVKQRKQGKAITHAAERENLHGDTDDLSDVFDWTQVVDDPDFDNASSFHSHVARLGALRDLPATSYVVDVRAVWVHECCEDCDMPRPDGWRVEVLHNDGRREALRFDSDPWVLLAHASPADAPTQAADMASTPTFEESLR